MAEPEQNAVLVADTIQESLQRLEHTLSHAGFDVRTADSGASAIERFYASQPHCVVARYGMAGTARVSLLDEVKGDNVYGHLPCIAIFTQDDLAPDLDWHRLPADDYLLEPYVDGEVVARVRLCLARAQRDVNANPLTGLPGNLTITREAERRLAAGAQFSFGYLDIDSFKAYNDKYGFSRGDEIIRMTARICVNALRALENEDTYVGHIGGDDFVFIVPCDLMPQVCQRICADFDLIVRNFYDKEDRDRGCIQSVDRQGKPHQYPLMSVSIGAVDTSITAVQHMAEMFTRVTEVKSFTKRLPGSNFIIDRRRR